MKMKYQSYRINEEQKLEIEKARKENRDKRVENRLRVLSLKAEGATYKEIMTITGYSKANIANILKTYFEKGISEIVTRKYYGNHRNLSFEEERELLDSFAKKAELGQIIEVKEIKAAYEEKVGHSTGGSQIYYVLARHGWRKIIPRSRHPKKASDEAIDASKKLTESSEKK